MKEKNEYWKIRSNILKAVENDDEETMRDYAASHPEIFKQLASQAKNSRFKVVRSGWRTR